MKPATSLTSPLPIMLAIFVIAGINGNTAHCDEKPKTQASGSQEPSSPNLSSPNLRSPNPSSQGLSPLSPEDSLVDQYRNAAVERWEEKIRELESLDADQVSSEHHILVIGSSSVRRWDTIEKDLAPYQPIKRGYGGAKWTDMAVFVDRLVEPHDFRAVVVFVANGIAGKDDDHDPNDIAALARHVVSRIHKHRPTAPVLLVEITPTSSRFKVWPIIQKANQHLRRIAIETPHTYFVATAEHYLKPDGTPRDSIFVDDRLHLNDEGYQLWGKLIRRRLDDVLRLEQQYAAASVTENTTE